MSQPEKKDTQKSAKSTTAIAKFTDEERAAMKELTAAEEARISALVKRAVS